ncbi:hypothetical protein FRB97_005873, partial [Tulasnella sp. 331]
MDGPTLPPATVPESRTRFGFSGGAGEDVDEFLQEATENRERARKLFDNRGEDIWLQPYFEARLAEPARGWFKNLDEDTRGDWDSATEALRKRYGSGQPPVTAPNPSRAATRPLSREVETVEETEGAAEYRPPPLPVSKPHSSWIWTIMVKSSLLAVSKLTKRGRTGRIRAVDAHDGRELGFITPMITGPLSMDTDEALQVEVDPLILAANQGPRRLRLL